MGALFFLRICFEFQVVSAPITAKRGCCGAWMVLLGTVPAHQPPAQACSIFIDGDEKSDLCNCFLCFFSLVRSTMMMLAGSWTGFDVQRELHAVRWRHIKKAYGGITSAN